MKQSDSLRQNRTQNLEGILSLTSRKVKENQPPKRASGFLQRSQAMRQSQFGKDILIRGNMLISLSKNISIEQRRIRQILTQLQLSVYGYKNDNFIHIRDVLLSLSQRVAVQKYGAKDVFINNWKMNQKLNKEWQRKHPQLHKSKKLKSGDSGLYWAALVIQNFVRRWKENRRKRLQQEALKKRQNEIFRQNLQYQQSISIHKKQSRACSISVSRRDYQSVRSFSQSHQDIVSVNLKNENDDEYRKGDEFDNLKQNQNFRHSQERQFNSDNDDKDYNQEKQQYQQVKNPQPKSSLFKNNALFIPQDLKQQQQQKLSQRKKESLTKQNYLQHHKNRKQFPVLSDNPFQLNSNKNSKLPKLDDNKIRKQNFLKNSRRELPMLPKLVISYDSNQNSQRHLLTGQKRLNLSSQMQSKRNSMTALRQLDELMDQIQDKPKVRELELEDSKEDYKEHFIQKKRKKQISAEQQKQSQFLDGSSHRVEHNSTLIRSELQLQNKMEEEGENNRSQGRLQSL